MEDGRLILKGVNAAILALLVIGGVSLACRDYQIDLKHGYLIGRVWSGAFVVVDPNSRIVVGPTIDGYQVSGDILFGRVRSSANVETYFIVDMKTRKLESGLAAAEWRGRLSARGIQSDSLKRPSRWDAGRKHSASLI